MNWQRALLVVARDALPALVENDDQPNLATLVDTLEAPPRRRRPRSRRRGADHALPRRQRAPQVGRARLRRDGRRRAAADPARRRADRPQVRRARAAASICRRRSTRSGPLVFVPRRGNDASTASIATVARPPGRGLDREPIVTRRRASTLAGLGVAAALAAALSMHARVAHAYTFIDELPEDPCARARSFDPQDTSPAAQNARRACRLRGVRAAPGRASAGRRWPRSRTRATPGCEKWMGATQPGARHPSDGGRGVRGQRHRQLRARLLVERPPAARARGPRRPARDELRRPVLAATGARLHAHDAGRRRALDSSATATSARSSATAFSSTSAALAIVHSTAQSGGTFLQGNGRAHSVERVRAACSSRSATCD